MKSKKPMPKKAKGMPEMGKKPGGMMKMAEMAAKKKKK